MHNVFIVGTKGKLDEKEGLVPVGAFTTWERAANYASKMHELNGVGTIHELGLDIECEVLDE